MSIVFDIEEFICIRAHSKRDGFGCGANEYTDPKSGNGFFYFYDQADTFDDLYEFNGNGTGKGS